MTTWAWPRRSYSRPGKVGPMRFELLCGGAIPEGQAASGRGRRRHRISVVGVAAGVAALIIALAITNGMRRDLQDKLLGSSAHVQLMQVEGRHPTGGRCWRACAGAARDRRFTGLVRAGTGGARRARWRRADRRHSTRRGATVSDLLSAATPGAVQELEPRPQTAGAQSSGAAADRSGQRPRGDDRRGCR